MTAPAAAAAAAAAAGPLRRTVLCPCSLACRPPALGTRLTSPALGLSARTCCRYESFAEVMWSGAAPPAADMPSWVQRYAERRYGLAAARDTAQPGAAATAPPPDPTDAPADAPSGADAARDAWQTLLHIFYSGAGEWGEAHSPRRCYVCNKPSHARPSPRRSIDRDRALGSGSRPREGLPRVSPSAQVRSCAQGRRFAAGRRRSTASLASATTSQPRRRRCGSCCWRTAPCPRAAAPPSSTT